jgi:hypothetical protein
MSIKFECPECGQRVSVTDDMIGATAECPSCSQPVQVPITIDRAKQIVEHAENKFASGRRIEYAFAPFKAAGASSPLEALHALFIVIADFFHFVCVRKSGSREATQMFDEYVAASRSIAMRLFAESTKVHSIAKLLDPTMIASLTAYETVDSFVSYLRKLTPTRADFWYQVYSRIGLPYPLDS